MIFTQSEKDEFIPNFLRWAEGQSLVRAALLTSTLAIPMTWIGARWSM